MNKKETDYFKTKLLEEKAELEGELKEVAQKEPGQNWSATSGGLDIDSADDNEVADKFEEYEGNRGVMEKLEKQLEEVDSALSRIEKGTYGICEVCQKPIEKDRLEANPSARNSIKHGH
jgi:RNA polymerase-binding protein DksA